MSKEGKEKFCISLLGKGYKWEIKKRPEIKDGCFVFWAKTSVEGRKTKKMRKFELFAGADTDVLIEEL